MNKSAETVQREKEESDRLVAEFIAKGGKVTVCEPFATTPQEDIPAPAWGKKRAKSPG
tara:strand:+ start:193 stop:366 length:174 start_codon:yes stop_codon:yes gene_type:complete